jgi:hypothetical protein
VETLPFTHIPNIAVFAHQDHRMEVATGRFKDQPAGTNVTKLETTMSFRQIKASVGLHEKIRQVRHEICQNRRETAQMRLEAIAGADNPYSLLQVFGRGHVIAKNGAVAYVTRCNPVEVLPRVSNNCRGDPRHLEWHQPLRGLHQLRDQVSSLPHQVQRHRPTPVEDSGAMVLRIPIHQGVCTP